MRKSTAMKHNNRLYNVVNFEFDGTKAKGYIRGRYVEGIVGSYVYPVKNPAPVTEVSNAKHFLIDHYEALYGDAPSLNGRRAETYTYTPPRIRNTHIVNLGNGTCIATGEVDGVEYSIEYNGSCEGYKGAVVEGKPWLGQARRDLILKADTEQAKKAAGTLVEFKAKYPHLIAEIMAELLA